VSFKFQEVY